MNILVAAIRAKNHSKSSGLNGHQNQMMNNYKPQFVLYDSDGEEIEANLSGLSMSYVGGSKQPLDEGKKCRSHFCKFWNRRTNLEKNLIMLIGGLFVLTLALSIGIGVMSRQIDLTAVQQDINEKNEDICNTTACIQAAKSIYDSMDKSADPCNDFYNFSCGQWVEKHQIPSDRSRYGNFDALDEQMQTSIKKELLSPKNTDSVAVKYASGFFKSCFDNDTLNKQGVQPLIDAMSSVGGWPIIKIKLDKDYSWQDALAKITGRLGLSSIFLINVQPDANSTLVNRLYIDAPGFGLGRNQLVNPDQYPDIIKAYKTYIFKTAVLLSGNQTKGTNITQQQVDEIVDFESKLAKLSTPQEDRRDANVWYNKMTFSQLNNLTSGQVDWVKVVNEIFFEVKSGIRIKSDELIVVQDIPYVKGVVQLLKSTPLNVIQNYFGWTVAMNLGYFTTDSFRNNEFEFNKVTQGVMKQAEMWRRCAMYLESTLQYAVSRKYVDVNFSKKDKQEALAVIKDIQESFRQLIGESDWLDDKTKQKSLEKLNSMILNVGYPDWILINEELDNYYNLTEKADSKHPFISMLYIQAKLAQNEFVDLIKPVNRTLNWPMPPAIVNAAYEPTQNSITIPAGILKPPFFDSQRPSYMNYGGIGVVIGHEFTHGFDDQGSQFDKDGNLVNWWTEQVSKRFTEKAQCFIKEYSDYIDPTVNMHLNGNNTVGENIADNGGVREAFNAYKIYVKRHGQPPKLPLIGQYSGEQIFFLSFANVWCSRIRPEALKQMIQYNPHSPAIYRVDVTLTNYLNFSQAYSCNSKSKMNPEHKCVLW